MTAPASTRKPFTTVTWEQIGTLGSSNRPGWEAQADLAAEVGPRLPHLTEETIRSMISATGNSVPVIITWETRLNFGGEIRIETTTDACVIEYMTVPRDLPGGKLDVNHLGYIRVSRSGFGGPIYLAQVREVRTFGAVRTYRDADEG